MEKKIVTIYAEASPNPESMKFVANVELLPNGINVDYATKEDAKNSPLAQELFDINYVERVFIAANFVTVTKNPKTQWVEIIPELRGYIKTYLEADKAVFTEMPQIEAKIVEMLDNYVRPAVEQDGGNIRFKSFKEGVVTVELQGSCSGCPSSTVTLKSGIENLLKRMVPEVISVEAEGEVMPDIEEGAY